MVLFAKDILEKEFLSLPKGAGALEAARLMKQRHQGFVVVSSDGIPEGIVTEWDYLSKITAEGADASKLKLSDIMSSGLITVQSGDGLETVAKVMTEKGVRRVAVIHDGRVVGVITSHTILARLEEYVNAISNTIARLQAPPF
jgi:CBS domain-containing protein